MDVENGSPARLQKIFYTMSRKNREYPCAPECSLVVENRIFLMSIGGNSP